MFDLLDFLFTSTITTIFFFIHNIMNEYKIIRIFIIESIILRSIRTCTPYSLFILFII